MPATPSRAYIHYVNFINGLAVGNNEGGGAILNQFNSLFIYNSSFLDNSAKEGGAISNDGTFSGSATLSVSRCSFLDNSSLSGGSAIVNDGDSGNATLSVSHSSFLGNSARFSGSGVFSFAGFGEAIFSLSDSIFAFNSAGGFRSDISGANGITAPSGKNLISNLLDSGLTEGENVIVSVDPRVAPRGDYGGSTETRPPLPGSPAIDAATGSTASTDLRGFPIVGTPDIGAVEYQGTPDIIRFWNIDADADGSPFGVELALGTDNFTPDPSNPANFRLGADSNGKPQLDFGVGANDLPGTVWIITRSPDLSEDSFQEIFRFDGSTTFPAAPDATVDFRFTEIGFSVTDLMPLPGKAFYRFEAISPTP